MCYYLGRTILSGGGDKTFVLIVVGGDATNGWITCNDWAGLLSTEADVTKRGFCCCLSALLGAIDSADSKRMGIIRSLGVGDKEAALTAMLISAFCITGAESVTADVGKSREVGERERVVDSGMASPESCFVFGVGVIVVATATETGGGTAGGEWTSRIGLRIHRMKAFSEPVMQSEVLNGRGGDMGRSNGGGDKVRLEANGGGDRALDIN